MEDQDDDRRSSSLVEPPKDGTGRPDSLVEPPKDGTGRPDSLVEPPKDGTGRPDSLVEPPKDGTGRPDSLVEPPEDVAAHTGLVPEPSFAEDAGERAGEEGRADATAELPDFESLCVLLVYVTPSAGHGLSDDGEDWFHGAAANGDRAPWLDDVLATLDPSAGERAGKGVAIAVERCAPPTERTRLLGEQRGTRMLCLDGRWHGDHMVTEERAQLGGLAGFIVWVRTEMRKRWSGPKETKAYLVILGDPMDIEELESKGVVSRRGAAYAKAWTQGLFPKEPGPGRSGGSLVEPPKDGTGRPDSLVEPPKDGTGRPDSLVEPPKDGTGRPLQRMFGTEPTEKVFARGRRIADELDAIRRYFEIVDGPVCHVLFVDDPAFSQVEVAYELRGLVETIYAPQVAIPRASGPLREAVAFLNDQLLDGDGRGDIIGAPAELYRRCKELLGRRYDESSARASAIRRIQEAVVHRGHAYAMRPQEALPPVNELGAEIARAVEDATPSERWQIHALVSSVVSRAESSCDLHSLANVFLRPTPEGHRGWVPGSSLIKAAHMVRRCLRSVEREKDLPTPLRHSLRPHLSGLTAYMPIDAEVGLSADYISLKILEDPEWNKDSGWTAMLVALRSISASPRPHDGKATARAVERMGQDLSAFWARRETPALRARAYRSGATIFPRKQWGLLMYLPGDGPPEVVERTLEDCKEIRSAQEEQIPTLYGLPHLRVAVQADFPENTDTSVLRYEEFEPSRGATRLSFGGGLEEKTLWTNESLGQIDSGNARTLVDFICWGAEHCSAHRLALIVTGHATAGGSFTLCHDRSAGSHLSLHEFAVALRTALDSIGRDKLDLLVLDMPGMFSLECSFELRDVARMFLSRASTDQVGVDDYKTVIYALCHAAAPDALWEPKRRRTIWWGDAAPAWASDDEVLIRDHMSFEERRERMEWEALNQGIYAVQKGSDLGKRYSVGHLDAIDPFARSLDLLCGLLLRHLDHEVVWEATLDALEKDRHGRRKPGQPFVILEAFKVHLGQRIWDSLHGPDSGRVEESSKAILQQIREAIERMPTYVADQAQVAIRCPVDLEGESLEGYLSLAFHQHVHFHALYSAVRLLASSKPHQLWDMISHGIAHTSGATRRNLLRRLTAGAKRVDLQAPVVSAGSHNVQFASLAPPPMLTLSLEREVDLQDSAPARALAAETRYRVRLASTESSATLPQNVCRMNREALDDGLANLEMLLGRMRASPAQWSYLESLGDTLGEDILQTLRDDLERLRGEVEADSPGNNVHLSLRVPRELMRYPWELMTDGHDRLALRFAVGRQVWTDDGRARPTRRRTGGPIRALIVGDPKLDRERYPRLAQLSGAAAEARAVADLFQSLAQELGPAMDFRRERDVHIHAPVTRSALRRLLRERSYDIVHFAGHGKFEKGHPERSAWALSDGRLWASELRNTLAWCESPPWLIYANACEAGMTADGEAGSYSGDVYGLATACINEGVRNYIAPLWPVGDETAKVVATTFYRELVLQRHTIGSAMRQARIRAKAASEASPGAYGTLDISWASMVLYGDPGERWLEALGG